ncbi:MAG: LysM domain/BON superfamily protein [bacterium ADurb.Bin374]|nr:MAG: LysM domain/BON superfamily protein [bacterium ADurb.Bin374]
MRFYRPMRARDPLLALLLSVGAAVMPVSATAQEYPAAMSDEAGQADGAALPGMGGLLQAPPKVVAMPLETGDVRAPIEPPAAMVNKARSRVQNTAASVRVAASNGAAQYAAPTAARGYDAGGYVVQAGDTAPAIAQKLLGNANRWQELMAYNRIADPNSLVVGQRLLLPAAAGAVRVSRTAPARMAAAAAAPAQVALARPAVAPAPVVRTPVRASAAAQEFEAVEPELDAAPTVNAPQRVSAPAVAQAKKTAGTAGFDADASYYGQSGGTYIVQKGDTLGKIAKKLLGSSKRWREIAGANPQINPNRLEAGMSLSIPGMEPPAQVAAAQSFDAGGQTAIPAYEPPPMAPPPPSFSAPPSAMMPPAPPAPVMPQEMEPPPPPPYMSTGAIPPAPIMAAPQTGPDASTTLYREEKYRIPDELKPTDFSPYFLNLRGYHGLIETESALIPYYKTWHFGFGFRYDKYKYLNGKDDVIDGRQWVMPVSLMYTGRKLMAGVTVPFQSWEVTRTGGGFPTVDLSGVHDPEVKLGYQIWKNYEGNHAVLLHVAGKFSSDNYHQPLIDLSGKSRVGVKIGPTNATRGSWVEFGGAYSGRISERWASHVNLGIANDAEDSISKYMYRGGVDYRVNQHFSLIGELDGESWEMDNGPDGPNIDLILGLSVFNESWQASLGFPMALQSDFGYGHDFGVTFGLNTRWD